MKVAEVDEAQLIEAVRQSSSWAEVKRRCGLSMGGAVHAALRRRVCDLGFPVEHLLSPSRKYSDELLADLVRQADSVADVLRALGLRQAGGTHAHVSRRVKALGCDTGHFTRRANARPRSRTIAPHDVLVRRPSAERRRGGEQAAS